MRMERPGVFWNLLTTFGLGYRQPASGTWGSLPSVALAGAMLACGAGPGSMPLIYFGVLGVVMVAFTLVCVLRGDEAEARWGVDPGQVVADETAGQCLALMFIPASAQADPRAAVFLLLAAFVLFRFFDIIKLEPARSLQRVPGGWGIALDDWAAGLYAGVVVWVLGLMVT
ncbi:MAG: phosphatidylglycerophosphatase A [Phycisphaerales bacterium]